MRRILIALAAVALLVAGDAAAAGRAGPQTPSIYAPGWRDGAQAIAARQAWRTGAALAQSGADVVAEASRWIGSANPTGTIGPWCADFVSFALQRVGLPPLPNRMASSALAYGPHTNAPRRGDLAVMPHHVGFVAGVEPDGSIDLLSGNYGRRVALAHVARSAFVAFVEPAGARELRGAGEVVHPRAKPRAKAKLARFPSAVKRP